MADLERPSLGDEDSHHLDRVLRLRPGEEITVSDGAGGWRPCRYVGGGRIEPAGSIAAMARPVPAVSVAFALTKGERPEWTVQKLAEAGVDHIRPMLSSRSVVRWDGEKSSRQVARLRSVAQAAAMQSRQVWLPVVHEVQSFADVVRGVGSGSGSGAAMAQPGGGGPRLDQPTILVGPEGGWDETELAVGLPLVGLGPTVLRAETAAMAAGLLLCALRAGTMRPAL